MAHKTLIGGTAYEITGGKTLVGGTAYSINGGKTLVGGTAYDVGFIEWPDDLDTGLEFASTDTFSISKNGVTWDGILEYCNGRSKGWTVWDGSTIISGKSENGTRIYIRGTGNTTLSDDYVKPFIMYGGNVECNGNIEKLLDYATVKAGLHPTMAESCFSYLFNKCTKLIAAPSFPATNLTERCYSSTFDGCTALTTIPLLPATTLAKFCYMYMFRKCTNIKLSSTMTGTYTKPYRVPYSGSGSTASFAMEGMFSSTGGTFTGTPTINTTYYLDSSITIV